MGDFYKINGDYLSDIAQAIRDKGGASGSMYVSNMASNIRSISGGGGTD